MNANQTLEIYKILNRYFKNEDDATRVVSDIQMIIENKLDETKEVLATKEDIANLRTELKVEMKETKAELIKWMLIFWISQLASLIAIFKFIIK